MLSEELRTAAEQARLAPGEQAVGAAGTEQAPAFPWKSLIRTSIVVSAIFSIFVFEAPPLAVFLAPVAMGIFAARHRDVRLSTTIGARTGLLCGMLAALGVGIVHTGALAYLRVTQRSGNPFDVWYAAVLQRMKEQTIAQSGAQGAAALQPFLDVPEFHSGLLLGVFAAMLCLLVLLAIAGGAFAGFLRSRAARAR